ncbi:unnamed protein product [Ectocarpus sp. 6 AP-2014]
MADQPRYPADYPNALTAVAKLARDGPGASREGGQSRGAFGSLKGRRGKEGVTRDGSMSLTTREPSTSRVDPVAVKRITPFVRPPINPEQLPPDYLALLSLTFGVAGLMLKSTWASWASVFCCMSSLGNIKVHEADPKQIGCSVLFACMGLFMNYFGPASRPIV